MTTSKSKRGLMALKIDLEKAFDGLEWSFIHRILIWFNFPNDWIMLIMSCISLSNLSVLINVEKLNPFLPSRGIHQGDLLSPYIFIVCMDYLADLINSKVALGNWTGLKTSRDGPTFTHLFFANDLILFAKAIKKNSITIKRVLNTFCNCSGQKVNHGKSKLFFSPHMSAENNAAIEYELGMNQANEFGRYLGVPIITDGRNKRAFDSIVDKVHPKLSSWNAKSLSMASRLTLINSVTSAMPTHLMQCTMLPHKICTELDKINRNFLWGDSTTRKIMHAIGWDVVTKPKHLRGLGIPNNICHNKALLAKRLWEFCIKANTI